MKEKPPWTADGEFSQGVMACEERTEPRLHLEHGGSSASVRGLEYLTMGAKETFSILFEKRYGGFIAFCTSGTRLNFFDVLRMCCNS